MAAGGHQRERRELHRRAVAPRFQNDGVDVALDVVDADERHAGGEAQTLGIGQAHQQGADQPGPHGHGDGGEVVQPRAGALQGLPHHRHDGAQVLARGEFGHHAAVLAVRARSARRPRATAPSSPSATTAAAVSSQEDSMPRMRTTSTLARVRRFQDQALHGDVDGADAAAGAVVEQAGSLPGAALGGALQVE